MPAETERERSGPASAGNVEVRDLDGDAAADGPPQRAPGDAPGHAPSDAPGDAPGDAPDDAPGDTAAARVGVVDIGSNTVRLVVYDVPTRLPIPVFNEKSQCRLGAGLGQTGRLSADGVVEALRTLRRFAHLARAMDVGRLELVATAAVRDASDGIDFIEAVERETGLHVHVLSGAEEARLAAVGVLNGTPDADGALADLGGGSLDLVGLEQGEVGAFATLPLGHLRLAEESGGDRAAAAALLQAHLASVEWLSAVNGRNLYCVGGSWRALARIFIDQTHHPLHVVDHFSIGFFEARRLADLLAGLSRATLQKLPGIDSRRRDSLPFAAAALAVLIERAAPREVVFSAYGMREGQMLELLPETVRSQDPLISACESQAERTGRFAMHGEEILEWMTPLFADERAGERRLRLAICLLSDIGWSEHPDYRAAHAFHRVLRVPYPGLTHCDRAEMALAVLVRYGGGDDEPMASALHALLDERRRGRARRTGLALRLAHTLSGGAPRLLPQTRLRVDEEALRLSVPGDRGPYVSEAVERRFTRLTRAMGLKAEIEEAPS
jgi:exopolyphosphatase/guanosine-5'-triphosphate,3'-diphosphate pyrophosphatase